MSVTDLSPMRIADLVGDFGVFAARSVAWLRRGLPGSRILLPVLHDVGVRSVPVVAVTGLFIGMVMSVQSFDQFQQMGIASKLGAMIDVTLLRELGPVLAATMLSGRVGSAMAAELATMKITEQIDALAMLGAHPLRHLVLPRLVACTLLVPLLTLIADVVGILGGSWVATGLFGVDPHHYWANAQAYVRFGDAVMGLLKAVVFGAAISLISCYRGFRSGPGAEGVGRAATEAFVASFIAVLVLDFFLAILLLRLFDLLGAPARHLTG